MENYDVRQDLALVSDLGNVIIKYDPRIICTRIREALSSNGGLGISDDELITRLWSEECMYYESGRFDGLDFFNYVSIAVVGLNGNGLSFRQFKEAWNSPFSAIPEVIGIYQRIIDAGHPFVQLTNTNPLHFEHVREEYPFVAANPAVLSYVVGAMKPDQRMFAAASRRAAIAPERCVYIDDMAANVEGAMDAGYKAAFQYTGDNKKLERFLSEAGFRS
jgi:putative hydrolase of the HAD superfamily